MAKPLAIALPPEHILGDQYTIRVTAMYEAVWSGAECGPCKLRDVCPDPLGPAAEPPRARGLVRLGRARRIALPGR